MATIGIKIVFCPPPMSMDDFNDKVKELTVWINKDLSYYTFEQKPQITVKSTGSNGYGEATVILDTGVSVLPPMVVNSVKDFYQETFVGDRFHGKAFNIIILE